MVEKLITKHRPAISRKSLEHDSILVRSKDQSILEEFTVWKQHSKWFWRLWAEVRCMHGQLDGWTGGHPSFKQLLALRYGTKLSCMMKCRCYYRAWSKLGISMLLKVVGWPPKASSFLPRCEYSIKSISTSYLVYFAEG